MEVIIKMNANVVYDVSNSGNIIGTDLIDQLFDLKEVTKIQNNVVKSIENCLYNGKRIKKAVYDMLVNELVLLLED